MENIYNLKYILNKMIKTSDKAVLIPHKYIDADALGSVIGMHRLLTRLNINSYILIDEEIEHIDNSIRRLFEINNDLNIISIKEYSKIRNKNDLVICLDFNKQSLLYNTDIIPSLHHTIVIDHHELSERNIPTKFKFINTSSSSASEIVTELLNIYHLKIDAKLANTLLAGIYLDSIENPKYKGPKTNSIIAELLIKGADINLVSKFFEPSEESKEKIEYLLKHREDIRKGIALSMADPNIIYTKGELAKAAVSLLNTKTDASFTLGYIDKNLLQISARSNGLYNVVNVMKEMGGGGTRESAATNIITDDMNRELLKLKRIIK